MSVPNAMDQINGDAEKELSLKDLFQQFKELIRYLTRQWKILLIVGVLFGVLGLIYALLKKKQYEAQLTFVLDESRGGGLLGSYSSIASQFGVDLGSSGGNGSGIFNEDNIMEFLKSKLMVERTLLSSLEVDGQNITLADYYIQIYGLKSKWKEHHPELNEFRFPLQSPTDSLNRVQDSIMTQLYMQIVKNNITADKPDKKLNFIAVKTTTLNEEFSKIFTERLVSEATRFYIETKTQRSQQTVSRLQAQADSILSELTQKTFQAAESEDLNQNPVLKVATVKTEYMTRDKAILQTMYGEVVRNLEMAKMSLSEETPVIQVVDVPRYPLTVKHLGAKMGFVLGMILGGFLASCFLIIKRLLI